MDIGKLEQTGALLTIIYLSKVKEASKTIIGISIHVSHETLKDKTFPFLEELGLISHIELKKWPFSHIYRLTEKGEKLAFCLSQIID